MLAQPVRATYSLRLLAPHGRSTCSRKNEARASRFWFNLFAPSVRSTCPCHMSAPPVRALLSPPARSTCSLHLLVPPARSSWSCHLLAPRARASCSCQLFMQRARSTCSCHPLVPFARTTCSFHVLVPPGRSTCSRHLLGLPQQATTMQVHGRNPQIWPQLQILAPGDEQLEGRKAKSWRQFYVLDINLHGAEAKRKIWCRFALVLFPGGQEPRWPRVVRFGVMKYLSWRRIAQGGARAVRLPWRTARGACFVRRGDGCARSKAHHRSALSRGASQTRCLSRATGLRV